MDLKDAVYKRTERLTIDNLQKELGEALTLIKALNKEKQTLENEMIMMGAPTDMELQVDAYRRVIHNLSDSVLRLSNLEPNKT